MDLVIQAPAIGQDALAAIVSLVDAQGISVLDGGAQQAYRLSRVRGDDGVALLCASAGIDHALVPPDLARARVSVVAIDMDSTLITIECIDEIADMLGVKAEVAAITAAAMRGDIDFRESLTRRVALLAGLPFEALARVYDERLALSPGAERMVAGFKAAGAKTLLVSGGFTFFTDRLKERLGFDDAVANTLRVQDGRLTGTVAEPLIDASEKAIRLAAMGARHGKPGGIIVAVGDGANDLPMLRQADVSIAYHANPVVRAQARYAINYCGLDAALNLFA